MIGALNVWERSKRCGTFTLRTPDVFAQSLCINPKVQEISCTQPSVAWCISQGNGALDASKKHTHSCTYPSYEFAPTHHSAISWSTSTLHRIAAYCVAHLDRLKCFTSSYQQLNITTAASLIALWFEITITYLDETITKQPA